MMLRTSLTGSYPPIFDPEIGVVHLSFEEQERIVHQSILRAYPNNPDARKAIKAQAKCRKAA